MADNNTFQIGDSEEFMGTLDEAIRKIQKVSRVTNNANKKLEAYAKTFDELNAKMAEYVEISDGVKITKTSGSYRTGSSSITTKSGGSDLSKGKFATVDKVLGSTTRLVKDLQKANISNTASSAIKLSNVLGTKMTLASGLAVSSLAALVKITLDASKHTADYSRSLKQMGVQLNKLERDSLDTANNISKLSNQMSNSLLAIGETFEPILNMLVSASSELLSMTGVSSSEPKSRMYGSQADISNSAKQSGFSLSSSNALAGGTYQRAVELAVNGENASDVAKKLADAWLTGSDAAKEYGVVVNDNVLTGYMASKGVDIVNVEITDAMKQYYRYQLMLEQTSASNSSSMQDMIKQWTQLGFTIDKTKGKLFSFDEVIQLTASDNTIPEVAGGLAEWAESGDPLHSGGGSSTNTGGQSSVIDANTSAIQSLTDAVTQNTASQQLAQMRETNLQSNADQLVAAQTAFIASQNALSAAQTNLQSAQMFSAVAGSFASQLISAGQRVAQLLNKAVSVGISQINMSTEQGVKVVSATANAEVARIINIADYQKSAINTLAYQGKMAVGQTTVAGVNSVNKAGKSNVINVDFAGKQNITNINRTGSSWISKIQSTGASILSQIASATGISRYSRYAKSISSSAKSGYESSGVRGAVTGAAKSAASSAKSSATAFITNPTDLISEGSDLINSLKQSDGSYNWGQLPKNTASMVVSSFTNPIKAVISGADAGYSAIKNTTGSSILGLAGGAAGGLANLAGYGLAEGLGDLGAVAETAQDVVIGAWNGLTGSKVSNQTALTGFNNWVDSGLNKMVNGYGFEHGGFITKEINNVRMGEHNKAEGVVPLEDPAGVKLMANVLKEAGFNGSGGDIIVNVTLSGLNVADNEDTWDWVGNKIAERIDINRQRRGELNYGSSF